MKDCERYNRIMKKIGLQQSKYLRRQLDRTLLYLKGYDIGNYTNPMRSKTIRYVLKRNSYKTIMESNEIKILTYGKIRNRY